MKGKLGRFGAVFALAALGAASSFGQFGANTGSAFAKYGPESPVVGDAGPILLKLGDKVKVDGSDTVYTIGPDGISLPIGVGVTISRPNEKDQRAVLPAPRSQHTLGLYPGTVFSIAGQLLDEELNQLVGGTKSIVGTVVTYDVVSNLDYGRRFELGGFYFSPDSDRYGDLYQLNARYFPNKQIGFQVAYIDSTEIKASSGSFHVLFDISAQGAGRTKGKKIGARLGVGTLGNFTKDTSPDGTTRIRRQTFNFSTFLDASLEITPRLSLNATEWFIRDRNVDINRFGIGLSYKF